MNQTTLSTNHTPSLRSAYSFSELARTSFPFESTSNIKIKITCYRVLGDGCIWEEISLMNTWWVSQSAIHKVLNASDGVFKRKGLMKT